MDEAREEVEARAEGKEEAKAEATNSKAVAVDPSASPRRQGYLMATYHLTCLALRV